MFLCGGPTYHGRNIFEIPMEPVINRLIFHRRWNAHFPRSATLPFTDADLIQSKDQFGARVVNMLSETLHCYIEECPRNIKPRISLGDMFCFEQIVQMPRNERIDSPPRNCSAKSFRTIMQQFTPVRSCVISGFGLDPVKNYLFLISYEFLMSFTGWGSL
jgi:hypothetical protein